MNKIILFGRGGLASFLSQHKKEETEILAYLDTRDSRRKMINGIPVIGIEKLNDYMYDYIVVAFSDVKWGFKILENQGIPEEKIVGYSFNEPKPYAVNEFQQIVNKVLNVELKNGKITTLFDIPRKNFYLCAMNELESDVVESDFVREQTLALLAYEIQRKHVNGNVAELGVFKGEFSKKINRLFPDRKLYLFDTFEGFDKRDTNNDKTLNWGERLENFNDTSVNEVISKMEYSGQCIIKKGFFPDTFDLVDVKFSLVSIDVDLYDPIKSGLEIFYPLLEKGGYIMVHDYNNIVYKGAKDAVIEYCDKKGISYVPISDIAGSIIITK